MRTEFHKAIRRFFIPLLLLTVAGCATRPPQPPVPQTLIPANTATTQTVSKPAERPPDALREFQDAARRMDFWLTLAIPPADRSEGPIVFQKYGYGISQIDYNTAFQEFLAGGLPTAAAEERFRSELSDQLMVLRWMEDRGQLKDPRPRVRARQQVRRLLTRIALENELGRVEVSDAEARALYQERIDEYQAPEMVQIRMILAPDEAAALSILNRIAAGESFRTIAQADSLHESRGRGGDIEPFARGAYIAELEDLAFSLPVGETGTVRTNVGTFVVQKVANIPAVTVPFEQARQDLRLELLEERRQALSQGFLEKVRREVSH